MTRLRRTRLGAACAALAFVVCTLGAWPATAVAEPGGGGELGPDYVRASASDLGAGSFPGRGLPSRAPSISPPYHWERRTDGRVCVAFAGAVPPELEEHVTRRPNGLAGARPIAVEDLPGDHSGPWLLDVGSPVPLDAVVVGPFVLDVGAPLVEGASVVVVPWCPTPGSASPPWEAPTPADIWHQTPLPRRAIEASPPGTVAWPGITRLATTFRSQSRPVTTVAVSLDGFSVIVTATPIAYAWSLGNGATQIAGDPPGTTVAFTRRGDYDVTLYVVWEARARLVYTAWGVDLGDVDLGTVTLAEHLPYHVAEIRAVLRTTPGRR